MSRQISELFKEYLFSKRLAANSIAIKNIALANFIDLCGDSILPIENESCFTKYAAILRQKNSPRTAETYKRNLSPFFSWLVSKKYLVGNPLSDLRINKAPQEVAVSFMPKELERVFTLADTRWRVILILGLCGLRRAEILNLCRNDFDLDAGVVFLTSKVNSVDTWEWENKNCLQTPIRLPPIISAASLQICPQDEILKLLNSVPLTQPYVCIKPRHYALMQQKKSEETISFEDCICPWRSFTRDFGLLLKKANVPHKRFEDLRVTYAANLAETQVKAKSAQHLLRHRKTLTTYAYFQRCKKCNISTL
ncbi:MAG: hypothetical protein A2Y12_16655 [Planctomycetes bacterium GWF2_42_9]|nr:MAG: hypothetical protein A2Y12_16655 [Planctomycetes bacterium GWF2_42_9]